MREMLTFPEEADVLEELVAWGKTLSSIRALILTSSRARSDGSADVLSDYDLIVAVGDATAFVADDAWASGYGQPLVRWGDQHELYGWTTYFRWVIYSDGVRVDYTVWPAVLLERVLEEAALPEDLALWRGEVVFAKFMLDYDTKFVALRRFLEWRVEVDHDWSLRPGAYGRGLERLLPADIWSELAGTYVGTDIEDNWNALFRTTALFRRVASDVGDVLGYEYPREKDEAVTSYLDGVRQIPSRLDGQ